MNVLERYSEEVLWPLLEQPREVLVDLVRLYRAALDESWRVRERFGPCPRPATAPTRYQLSILSAIELTEGVLWLGGGQGGPPRSRASSVAPCSVEYVDWPSPGRVIVTCLLEGTTEESWGHGERSLARCFALLREGCPCGLRHEEGELEPEEDDEGDEGAAEDAGAAPVPGLHGDVPGVREPGPPAVDPGEVPVVRVQGDLLEHDLGAERP